MNPMLRLLALLRPRARRVDVLVAVLLALLGFGLAVQVRSTQKTGILASARPEDLVTILDDLNNRSDRLRQEISTLEAQRDRLTSGSGAAASALADARRRTQILGVIAGTTVAVGPGVRIVINDPKGTVSASLLLDAMEELRNAGAEAMQIDGTGANDRPAHVRVVVSTSFVDTSGGVAVDGVTLRAPYDFVVIGDPGTLSGAMTIPGGVSDTVRQQGGSTEITRLPTARVFALHALAPPRYARAQ